MESHTDNVYETPPVLSVKMAETKKDEIPAASLYCWQVCGVMCCDKEKREKHKNNCLDCGECCVDCCFEFKEIWILLAFVCVSIGLVYIWAIPYSNGIVLMLWPDVSCTNVWKPCDAYKAPGLATFLGAIVHGATIDLFITGTCLFILSVATGTRFKRDKKSCCCPIVRTRGPSKYSWDGCGSIDTFSLAVVCLFISLLVSLIILCLYVGRLVAFVGLPQCVQFFGTIRTIITRSFRQTSTCAAYRPDIIAQLDPSDLYWRTSPYPNFWVPLSEAFVFVPNSPETNALLLHDARVQSELCSWCQDVGFVILFFSVIGLFLFTWITTLLIFWCRHSYRNAKKKLVIANELDIPRAPDLSAVENSIPEQFEISGVVIKEEK